MKKFSKSFLDHPTFAEVNKYAYGLLKGQIELWRINKEISKLDYLAIQADYSPTKTLQLLKYAEKDCQRQGLATPFAVTTTSGSLAFAAAWKDH